MPLDGRPPARADIDALIVDEPERGLFRVHRDVFTRADLFELEMAAIFERSWVFLALDCQLPNPHDFLCLTLGRQPIILTRSAEGRVGAFLNSCRHKGAMVSRRECGNAKRFVCPYHGWVYDTEGRNIGIKDHPRGAYPGHFEAENHDLVPIARLSSYRGLIFGSLSADVPALEDYLGDTRFFIDLIMDQGENGMEIVPGRNLYTFNGNWKFQLENQHDLYHLTSTHPSFMSVVARRKTGASANVGVSSRDFAASQSAESGMFTFPYGHALSWTVNSTPSQKPIHRSIDSIRTRVGSFRAEWMLNYRNLNIFPNLQLADTESLIVRTIRPVAADRTEMRIHCFGPAGEAAEIRKARIRQHEDFFNVSGMATPDDAAVYEDCQLGGRAHGIGWHQSYVRGTALLKQGGNDLSRSFGLSPVTSLHATWKVQNEVIFHPIYREWKRLMRAGLPA